MKVHLIIKQWFNGDTSVDTIICGVYDQSQANALVSQANQAVKDFQADEHNLLAYMDEWELCNSTESFKNDKSQWKMQRNKARYDYIEKHFSANSKMFLKELEASYEGFLPTWVIEEVDILVT